MFPTLIPVQASSSSAFQCKLPSPTGAFYTRPGRDHTTPPSGSDGRKLSLPLEARSYIAFILALIVAFPCKFRRKGVKDAVSDDSIESTERAIEIY